MRNSKLKNIPITAILTFKAEGGAGAINQKFFLETGKDCQIIETIESQPMTKEQTLHFEKIKKEEKELKIPIIAKDETPIEVKDEKVNWDFAVKEETQEVPRMKLVKKWVDVEVNKNQLANPAKSTKNKVQENVVTKNIAVYTPKETKHSVMNNVKVEVTE